jgi:carboxyl-terminal processing protease
MQTELLAAINRLNLEHPDAYVIDIRDGWGGAAPRVASIFDEHVPVLESEDRTGEKIRMDAQVRNPAVLLVNGGTRSGKEVIAFAVKKHHLATLVGSKTAGALLPGSPYCLPDGALLFLAVAKNSIDGHVLEGVGITPDVVVPFDIRYSGGSDPQLRRALEVASEKARHSMKGRGAAD